MNNKKHSDMNSQFESMVRDSLLEDTYIFHIPHSGNKIPDFEEYVLTEEEVIKEHSLLTDRGTDEIFKTKFTSLVFPYSRVYCDVERLPDDQEEMFKKGRGFYYTKTDAGKELRCLNDKEKIKQIYNKWHLQLESAVEKKLNDFGSATMIDCHSFSDKPFLTDYDQNENRPDFCLGTDDFHTPDFLVNFIKKRLENEGFSVKINSPYVGTIVPLKFYKTNGNVQSIMIEINRKLFQVEDALLPEKVTRINKIMNNIFLNSNYKTEPKNHKNENRRNLR